MDNENVIVARMRVLPIGKKSSFSFDLIYLSTTSIQLNTIPITIDSLQYKLKLCFPRSLPSCTVLPWIRANLVSISSKGEISDLF